jgi:pyruvate formate lyase activating enzyme
METITLMKPIQSINRRDFMKTAFCCACSMALGIGCGKQSDSETAALTPPPESLLKYAVRSPWYDTMGGNRVQCTLCPKKCILSAGETSPCRVRINQNGSLYTFAYGNPSLVLEDAIERNPFMHVLPGSRVFSIATPGCNLSCKFCEVWDMALVPPEEVRTYDMPVDEVVSRAQESGLQSIGYAFGEPAVFYEYMTDIAKKARDAGLLNVMQTAGYFAEKPLQKLLPLMNAANIDLKSFDPDFYREIVGGELSVVLNTIRRIQNQGIHLEITNILIPSLNDDMDLIHRMSRWIVSELGPDIPLHFVRFYPLYRLSNLPQTPVSTLDRARKTAMDAGLKYVYVSRVTGHEGENTFCPECGQKIINRLGFVIDENHVRDGRCGFCEAHIPGIWA